MVSNELSSLIERTRTKLLDLTNRNRLLNYPKNRSSNRLIIIDELPNQLFSSIVESSTSMLFKSIPMPTPEEMEEHGIANTPDIKQRAIALGLNPSPIAPPHEDEPTENHSDVYIQTLHYPKDMDRILGRLYSESREVIEETGVNMLYLVIGFLEWNDFNDNTKRFAPLIMVPVQIEKGSLDTATQTYNYKLSYTDEDIVTNLALKVKLQRDMGAYLPELEEGMNPEQYLASFETLLRNNPTFKIHREFALDFLKFSKILMYLDLDPSRWPEDKSLLSNETLKNIFLSAQDGDTSLASDYPIDFTPDAEAVRLIVDADSSQHSAIIDVHKGKSLVIEGPPGTGKSQTITNIIADGINQGKKILFVAEKLAALDVVKSRLEEAGLGDFCLELHSHKSHKQRVYQDLAKRIERTFDVPRNIESKITELKILKESLNDYTILLSKVHPSGFTLHQILGKAELYRMDHINPPSIVDANMLSESDMSARRHAIRTVTSFIKERPGLISSPWNGYFPSRAIKLDADEIIKRWGEYVKSVETLHLTTKSYQENIELPTATVDDILCFVEIAKKPFFEAAPNDEAIRAAFIMGKEKAEEAIGGISRLIEQYDSRPQTHYDLLVDEADLKRYEITFLEYKDSNWFVKLFSGPYRDAKRKFKIMFPATAVSEAEDVLRNTRHFANELRSFCGQMEELGLIEFARAIKTAVPTFSLENIPQLVDKLKRLAELENVMKWIDGFAETELHDTIKKLVYDGRASEVKRAIDSFVKTVAHSLSAYNEALQRVVEFGEIDFNRFYGSDQRLLSAMIEKHRALESNTQEMGDWIEYCRSSETIMKFDLEWIIEAIRTTQIKPEEAEKAFDYAYFQTLALQIMRQNPELGGFSRQAHEQKIKKFQTLDSEIIELNRQLIAANAANVVCPPGVQTGRVASLTEMGLLKNEIRKRTQFAPQSCGHLNQFRHSSRVS